jgi:hypothetical protein
MASSKPVTWLISDIINWFRAKELIINESFQRHSVWAVQAKVLFIDSILNELPMPKIFIRTKIDSKQQKTIKEIVDGQQRIRSIIEYANDDFVLSDKSINFSGKKYSDLSNEQQSIFLGYAITADQLLNATDDDVIDIFARLNSYTVSLNAAEKRHAAFQTELKFFVRDISIQYRWFIEKYNVFSIRQRFRMLDDEFFAELVRLINNGLEDGGADRINKFYKIMTDKIFTDVLRKNTAKNLDKLILFLDRDIGIVLKGSLGKHYQIYTIAAAYLCITNIIETPSGAGVQSKKNLLKREQIVSNLGELERQIDNDENNEFVRASSSTTQRIASRLIRLKSYMNALGS